MRVKFWGVVQVWCGVDNNRVGYGVDIQGDSMRAKPFKYINNCYTPCATEEATHIVLHCPGPIPTRMLPVGVNHGWKWNGDTEKPTITPSIRTSYLEYGKKEVICHSYVTDGKIQFLDDCTHVFAGQTLDLLEVEE